MRLIINNICIAGLIFALSGCVVILGRKRQKVQITSATPNAEIFIADKNKHNDTIKQVFQKDRPYAIKVVKHGYKTRQEVLSPEKTTFLVWGDVLVAPVLYGLFTFVSLLIDGATPTIKWRRYKSNLEIEPLIPLPKKKQDEKYIWVEDVIVNIHEGDVLGKYYASTKRMKRDKSYKEYKADESGLYDVPQFKLDMNDILLSYGYTNTSENIIASSWNSLYLTSEIKLLNTNIASLKGVKTRLPNALMNVELDVEWVLYDGYGKQIFKTLTFGVSDNVWASPEMDDDSWFQKSMKDAIEYAMLDLYADPEFKALLQLDIELATGEKNQKTVVEVAFSSNDEEKSKLEDQLKSIVRITSDDFNYSGTVISEKGYIVTSYQAISSGKELMVQVNGEQIRGEVISTNAQLNLALIKVESDSLWPFQWSLAQEPKVGEKVYTLSFSRLEALDRYVSSGIISGFRSFQSKPYIQSDVPMSIGNSGGIMIDSNGRILGILNSKVNSEGIEGIGFAVPMDEVIKGLGITVK